MFEEKESPMVIMVVGGELSLGRERSEGRQRELGQKERNKRER